MFLDKIKSSRCHLTRDLSPGPKPHCWIPLARSRCQSLGQSPHYPSPALTRDPTRHWVRLAESRSRSPLSGCGPTSPTRCLTARSPRLVSSWAVGRCPSPHRTAGPAACGDWPPRCRPRSGCRPSRSPLKRPVSSAAHHPSRCRCSWAAWQRERRALLDFPSRSAPLGTGGRLCMAGEAEPRSPFRDLL